MNMYRKATNILRKSVQQFGSVYKRLLSNYLTTVNRQVRTESDDTDHNPNYFISTLQKAIRNITFRFYVGDVTT